MVHMKPTICQSLLALPKRLSEPVDDFLVHHPAFVASLRLTCFLFLIILLLLSTWDVYCIMMMRTPRDPRTPQHHRGSGSRLWRPNNPYVTMWADEIGGEKSWIRRLLVEREELLPVDELKGAKSDVNSQQSTATLVVRDLAPGALVCVPDEPVLLLPRDVDVQLSSAQDEGLLVPVEE